MKKITLILIILIIVIIGLILSNNYLPVFPVKSVLYKLDNPKNSQIQNKYPYLRNLSEVSYWQTLYDGEKVMAISSKKLNKDDFITIIDDLVKGGYVQQGGWNQTMEITQRKTAEDEKSILITDEGINSVFNDTPPFQTTKSRIVLEYRYDKNSNTIFFKASK